MAIFRSSANEKDDINNGLAAGASAWIFENSVEKFK